MIIPVHCTHIDSKSCTNFPIVKSLCSVFHLFNICFYLSFAIRLYTEILILTLIRILSDASTEAWSTLIIIMIKNLVPPRDLCLVFIYLLFFFFQHKNLVNYCLWIYYLLFFFLPMIENYFCLVAISRIRKTSSVTVITDNRTKYVCKKCETKLLMVAIPWCTVRIYCLSSHCDYIELPGVFGCIIKIE